MQSTVLILSTTTSVVTLMSVWLLGSRHRSGWVLSAANQVQWVALAIMTGAWGLVVLAVVFCVLAIRGWKNWA